MTDHALLQIEKLAISIRDKDGEALAVDDFSLSIANGQSHGLVGESGSGKSLSALSILQLLPPAARLTKGTIRFKGDALEHLDEKALRSIRGNRIAMIFQEPMTALNPGLTVGNQIAEVFQIHAGTKRKEAFEKAIALLERVGISSPKQRAHAYAHQLSGGMRQRVMIAMAIAQKPDLLIADEATTALDVTIEAQIMTLIKSLQREMGLGLLLITHNLALARLHCDVISVMYAGSIVERASAKTLFQTPRHPYTLGLMKAIPSLECPQKRLEVILGRVPALHDLPKGCHFHPRCTRASTRCKAEVPALVEIEKDHQVRCFHPVKEP